LVLTNGWRHSAVGKVTIGLASHRPSVTEIVVYPYLSTGSLTYRGQWVPCLHSLSRPL